MKNQFLGQLINFLLSALTPEMMKRAVDAVLDVAERAVAESETKLDDAIVLPLIDLIRNSFNIPDNDEPEKAEG